MADPIVLAASGSEEALVTAIAAATDTGAPLHLGPGVHLTKPGRRNLIPIGPHGLSISRQPSAQDPATIRRPDDSLLGDLDWSFGLFFIPARPTDDEEAQLTWRPGVDSEGPMEFDVIVRGQVTIDGLRIDCNMGNQGLGQPPPNPAEHSAMLGFRGHGYRMNPGQFPRRIAYVGFASVKLTDLVIENGGFSSDVWFSRGGFYPNIGDVVADRLVSTPRVNDKRAALDFSGLARTVTITNSRVASIGLEHTTGALSYDRLPRVEPDFVPSAWRLVDVATDGVELGASGFVYEIEATRLTTRRFFYVDRASGTVSDSSLVVDDRRRMNRLPGFEFRRVRWTLPHEAGHVKGLRPTSLKGDPCRVAFVDNTFRAPGATTGQILDSEYSPPPADPAATPNSVEVTALGCTYPDGFGTAPDRAIARVNERGTWRFAQADLGTLDPDVALPKIDKADVHRLIV